jgi:hypothetical protein
MSDGSLTLYGSEDYHYSLTNDARDSTLLQAIMEVLSTEKTSVRLQSYIDMRISVQIDSFLQGALWVRINR